MCEIRRRWSVFLGVLLCVGVIALPAHAIERSARSRIVFLSDRTGSPQVWIMNPSGSHQTQLTDDPAFKNSPRLSPNGKRIVLQRLDTTEGGTGCLWVMKVDGTHGHQLFPPEPTCAGQVRDPAWSPDGTQIAFVNAGVDEVSGIMVINADGSGAHLLLPDEGIRDCCLAWSPDGTKIAFTHLAVAGHDHIVVTNVDGSGSFLLTGDHPRAEDTFDTDPAWSPDGTRIAFHGKLNNVFMGPSGIWVINADGSNPVELTQDGSGSPSWAPDGRHIAFSRGSIWKMKPDGTHQQDLGADGYEPSWGPRPTPRAPHPGR